jgi:MFS family permease
MRQKAVCQEYLGKETPTMTITLTQNPMLRVLGLRDFRLLFAGTTTSLLGDQLYLIATPWLVLTLTGDPLALGVVLALEGLPRAIFMLVGGAITDRLSPRTVMLASDIIRFVLTTLMALAVFSGAIQIWMLYAFGLGFGLVSGFAVPAGNSIVPMLVVEQDLQAGNAIMMGMTQLIGFVGPTAAGILIGGFAGSFFGVGLALAFDAATFAVSALCLWLIRSDGRPAAAGDPAEDESVWASIVTGVKHMWSDPALRLLLLILMALNFFFSGPLLVGIPVLANQYLPEGALAFGLLMSAMAGGSLVGILLAGALPRPGGKGMSTFLIVLLVGFSLVLGAFGFIRSTWVDVGLMLLVGIGNGYIMIIMFTWMQTNTPKAMLGRMMSMVMLASSGLIPVSQAISGALIKWNLTMLLASTGALLLLVALWSAFQPGLRLFSQSLTAAPVEA